jgi:ribonucleoside-diphosphate reductase alpha chain
MLPTGIDHLGKERTAVCCLSSLNIETWDRVERGARLCRGRAALPRQCAAGLHRPRPTAWKRAKYSAMRERSVGLGVMGFHSFLQARTCRSKAPWPSRGTCACSSKRRPKRMRASYSWPRSAAPARTRRARHDGALQPQDRHRAHRLDLDHLRRHQRRHRADPGQCIYTHKTLSGAFSVRNPYLQELLAVQGPGHPETWASIVEQEGSVQHLDCLSDDEKDVYRTAFEIDQRWMIELAADRTPFICQSQSLNLFLPADIDKVGPAHAALDGVGARHQEPLLLPLQIHQPRRFRRPVGKEGRQGRSRSRKRRPIMKSASHVSD